MPEQSDDRSVSPPTEIEQARYDAIFAIVTDADRAFLDGDIDGSEAALAQFIQLASQIDIERFVNAEHMPSDAGENAEGLRRSEAPIDVKRCSG